MDFITGEELEMLNSFAEYEMEQLMVLRVKAEQGSACFKTDAVGINQKLKTLNQSND